MKPLTPRPATHANPLSLTRPESSHSDATPAQIELCLRGDALAWESLVKISYARVYATCYRFMGSHDEAEDLTQDVFIKVFCNLHSYDPTRGNFRYWLQNVTRNYLVDHFRRTRLLRASSSLDQAPQGQPDGPTLAERLADTRPTQEDYFVTRETHSRVHEALQLLSPCNRDAVMLCAIEERNEKDAAQLLNIAEGTVKSRLNRAKMKLQQLLIAPQPLQT